MEDYNQYQADERKLRLRSVNLLGGQVKPHPAVVPGGRTSFTKCAGRTPPGTRRA